MLKWPIQDPEYEPNWLCDETIRKTFFSVGSSYRMGTILVFRFFFKWGNKSRFFFGKHKSPSKIEKFGARRTYEAGVPD